MTDDHLSRADATQILSEIKCLEDSKYGLPELERQIWETLVNKFKGIREELVNTDCPNQVPEVFRDFFDTLNW